MAKKAAPLKRGSQTEESDGQEITRPKGPAAVGFQRHQGTRKHRRQRSN